MRDIQRADQSAKRRAVFVAILGSLIGTSALFALERSWPSIERWLRSDPAQLSQRLAILTGFLALVTVVPLLACAIYLWARGARIRRHQRFPLEDERLLRDTGIVHGEAAAIRGRLLQSFAIALAMLALGLALALWRLVQRGTGPA